MNAKQVLIYVAIGGAVGGVMGATIPDTWPGKFSGAVLGSVIGASVVLAVGVSVMRKQESKPALEHSHKPSASPTPNNPLLKILEDKIAEYKKEALPYFVYVVGNRKHISMEVKNELKKDYKLVLGTPYIIWERCFTTDEAQEFIRAYLKKLGVMTDSNQPDSVLEKYFAKQMEAKAEEIVDAAIAKAKKGGGAP